MLEAPETEPMHEKGNRRAISPVSSLGSFQLIQTRMRLSPTVWCQNLGKADFACFCRYLQIAQSSFLRFLNDFQGFRLAADSGEGEP